MVHVTKEMTDKLQEWLSSNFPPIIETTGTVVCRLKFKLGKVSRDIAIAFTRYIHSNDPAEYIIGDEGYVLTVPSFWLGIPKELVVPYLCSYIDGYLDEYVIKNSSSSGSSSGSSTGSGNCGCPTNTKPKPPQHSPVPKPPIAPPPHLPIEQCETCDTPNVPGYFISEPTPGTGSFNNVIKNG